MREIQKIFYKNLQMVSLTYLWSMILRHRNQSIDSHRNIVGTLRLTGLKIWLQINHFIPSNPSPVIKSRKNFWVQRKFLFHVLIWPYYFQKILVQATEWSTSPKIPDFRNGGKSPWSSFSYVGSKFKCLPTYISLERKFCQD